MPEANWKKCNWDGYWKAASKDRGLYESIARLYRRFIISHALKFYFHKFCKDGKDRIYLHAGCGSAESDYRINFKDASFVLMDLSIGALKMAKKMTRHKKVHFVCGDLLHLPFKEGIFNGVWNLGVMEHFHKHEVIDILREFKQVLRDEGRYLIFWPPKYGLSVMVLSIIPFIANKIFRRFVVLHPPEVSRFLSKRWAEPLFKEAGLDIASIYFNIRDLFTHVVLVGQKRISLYGR